MAGGYGYRDRKDPPRPGSGSRITAPPRLDTRRQQTGAAPLADAAPTADGGTLADIRSAADAGAGAGSTIASLVAGGFLSADEGKILALYDSDALQVVTGALARIGARLVDTEDDLKLPASQAEYEAGVTVDALRPAQAGADVTGDNVAGDVLTGAGKAVAEAGADRTANNTAADAANLNGVASATVQGEGQEGYRRVGTLYDDDGVLGGSVLQRDGLGALQQVIARGLRFDYGADGDGITFTPPFQSAPLILLFNVGGRSYDGGLAAQQYVSLVPESPSVSGFVIRARIREAVGGTTANSAAFSGDPPTATKAGATEAWDDRYTVGYAVDVPSGDTATVTLYTRPSAAAAWTQRGSWSYREGSYGSETRTVTVDGLGAGSEFQLVLTTRLALSGATLTATSVGWQEATAPTDSSMTPSGEKAILWVALAGV